MSQYDDAFMFKQYVSNIWRSIHEKVKQHWGWVEKKLCLLKKRCLQKSVAYKKALLIKKCCLQKSVAYKKVLLTKKRCLQKSVAYKKTLLTKKCCLQKSVAYKKKRIYPVSKQIMIIKT